MSEPVSSVPTVSSSEVAEPSGVASTAERTESAENMTEEQDSSDPVAAPDNSGAGAPFLSSRNLSPEFLSGNPLISETGTVSTFAGEIEFITDEELELLLRVMRGRRTLSNVSVGIQKGFSYYVPLLELARLTQLNAVPDFENEVVEGFFVSEENPYSIDFKNGTYTIFGETKTLPEGSVIVSSIGHGLGEFYVELGVMNEIWPLDLDLNFADLVLSINTTKRLPEDLSRRRQQKWQLLKDSDEIDLDAPGFIYVPNNYKTFTPPTINLTNTTRWRSKKDQISNSIGISGQNDFLGTNANFNLSLLLEPDDTPEVTNTRLKFTRRDYGDGSLPFGLKLVEGGDVSARPSDLIDSSITGRGFVVSNRPVRKSATFDEITVEGTAEPGWEIELYNGGQLLEFGVVPENGEYRFENVPLGFGNNAIRVLLYGPQGQIEEREEQYRISGKMLLPGETTYEVSVVDTNEDFIRIDDRNAFLPKGVTYQGRVDQGINRWVSAFVTYTETPTEQGDKRYVSAGANMSVLGGAAQVEAYNDLGGGEAYDFRYLTQFSGVRLNLRSSIFKDFESEEAGFGSRARTFEGEARVDTRVKLPIIGNLALSLDYLKRKYEDGTTTSDVDSSMSAAVRGVRVTNKVKTNLVDGHHKSTRGDISASARVSSRWNVRGRLDYDLYPERSLSVADMELRYRTPDKFTAALDVSRDLQTEATRIGANASYDFGTFLGGVDIGWSAAQGFNLGLRATTALGPYGEDGRYIASSDSFSGRHRIEGRIFEDLNNNGVFDEGDRPLEKSRFKVNQQRSKESDENGVALVDRAGPPGPALVYVEQESLPDPFLAPTLEGYSTIVRPTSKYPTLDFPVILTGTIDGIVYFEDGTPVPGLIIELRNDQNEVIQETTTQFDGFYTFEYVKPGSYTVVVSASHQVSVPPQTVRVSSDDLFAYGVDLHFVEQANDEMVAAEADGGRGRIALYHAPATGGTEKPAPHLSDSGFQTTVRAVRIGEHPYKVRLVLDLSGQSGYSISSENGGDHINIDLPSTAWDANRTFDLSTHALFENCEVLALTDETGAVIGTRIRLKPRTPPVEIFYNNDLPPENGHGHRIYVDFLKK